jgi:hypothetical protein
MRYLTALFAVTLLLALAPAAVAVDTASATKVFVCKYVGTPGDDERLQTGQNPIDVDVSAIKEDPVVVGSFFADAQGRSFVLAFDTGQDEPDVSECPPPDTGPTPTPVPTPTPTLPPPPPPTPTPSPTPTETPTSTPTPTPTVTPTPTPTETPTPTPTETPSGPPTPTPSGVEIETFAFDVCPITGEPVPSGRSAIRIRAFGALLLIALHVRIDGTLVTPDSLGEVFVTPGVHAISVTDSADIDVLASTTVDCPVCNLAAVTPTPPPATHHLPPTDTLDASSATGVPATVPLVALLVLSLAILFVTPRRKRR